MKPAYANLRERACSNVLESSCRLPEHGALAARSVRSSLLRLLSAILEFQFATQQIFQTGSLETFGKVRMSLKL
jgi:hypothetical protein